MRKLLPQTAFAIVSSLAVGGLLTIAPLPASAANTTAFCKDVATITKVPTPTLPTSNSLSAIAKAVSLLPTDVTTLDKLQTQLAAGAAAAPSSALASVYRVAATQVNNEGSDVSSIIKDERALLTSPKNYSFELALVSDLISATTAAATANAYLSVDHASVLRACK